MQPRKEIHSTWRCISRLTSSEKQALLQQNKQLDLLIEQAEQQFEKLNAKERAKSYVHLNFAGSFEGKGEDDELAQAKKTLLKTLFQQRDLQTEETETIKRENKGLEESIGQYERKLLVFKGYI